MPLLLTRAEEDAASTVARLPPEFEAVIAPALAYEATGSVAELLAAAPSRPTLLVTTPRSVPVAVALSVGREVVALAPRTSAALVEAGVTVRPVCGGVEQAMATLDPASTLLLTSDLGAHTAARRWPTMAVLVTHRTVAPASLPAPAAALLASGTAFAVFFASPSAVENFEHLAPGAAARAAARYVHGASTAAALTALGLSSSPLTLGA